jgi:hypothetical protein
VQDRRGCAEASGRGKAEGGGDRAAKQTDRRGGARAEEVMATVARER